MVSTSCLISAYCSKQRAVTTSLVSSELLETIDTGKRLQCFLEFCRDLNVCIDSIAIFINVLSSVETLEKAVL